MSLTVIKPGMLSSFQDRGRDGYQHQGIPAAGAMDERAHRLANALAGNEDDRATLEITLTGPTLRFDAAACFALAGADLGAQLNGGHPHAPAAGRPARRHAGLRRPSASGARAPRAWRLCAASGDGQRDHLSAQRLRRLPGTRPGPWRRVAAARPLDVGRDLAALQEALWQIRVYLPATLAGKRRDTIRFLPGRHWHEFSDASRAAFAGRRSASARSPIAWATGCRGPRWPWRNRARRCRKRPASAPCRCHPAAKPSSSWPTGRPPAATPRSRRSPRWTCPRWRNRCPAGAAFPADRAGRGAAPGRRARARFAQLRDALAPMRALL